jgi:hypothetical protein
MSSFASEDGLRCEHLDELFAKKPMQMIDTVKLNC